MKKITLLTIVLLTSYYLFSQSTHTVEYFNWSNPNTFNLSPSPIIKGYGFYSDSLSEIFDGKTFYEHNDEYYCIESWADYYYWFTQKYSCKFSNPELYEYYYWIEDNFGMTSYIASYKYLEEYYPSLVKLNFGDLTVKNNRLIDDKYFAQNVKEIERFNKQLGSTKSVNNYSTSNSQNQAAITKASETIKREFVSNNKIHKIDNRSKSKIAPTNSGSSSPKSVSKRTK